MQHCYSAPLSTVFPWIVATLQLQKKNSFCGNGNYSRKYGISNWIFTVCKNQFWNWYLQLKNSFCWTWYFKLDFSEIKFRSTPCLSVADLVISQMQISRYNSEFDNISEQWAVESQWKWLHLVVINCNWKETKHINISELLRQQESCYRTLDGAQAYTYTV